VAELVEATVQCVIEVAGAMRCGEGTVIPLKHPRLADGILRLHNRLLETELGLLQLRTKGHGPGKPMLIADRINRTLLRLGVGEEGVRIFWADFYSEDGPVESTAKRKAAERAARRRGSSSDNSSD
jgi:hypothetical protein